MPTPADLPASVVVLDLPTLFEAPGTCICAVSLTKSPTVPGEYTVLTLLEHRASADSGAAMRLLRYQLVEVEEISLG